MLNEGNIDLSGGTPGCGGPEANDAVGVAAAVWPKPAGVLAGSPGSSRSHTDYRFDFGAARNAAGRDWQRRALGVERGSGAGSAGVAPCPGPPEISRAKGDGLAGRTG